MLSLMPFNRNGLQKRSANEFEDFYNMIDDFFYNSPFSERGSKYSSFRVDVKDETEKYVVEAELPGFDKQEINLDFEDGKLLISATKDEEENVEKSNYIHRERRQCSMQRVIYLKDVNSEEINAKLDNGVLTIEVPKLNQIINKRQIEIR